MKKFLLVSGTLVIAATHAFLQASDGTMTELKIGNFSNLNSTPSFEEMIDRLSINLNKQSLEEIADTIEKLNMVVQSSDVAISPYTLYKILGLINTAIEEKITNHGNDIPSPSFDLPKPLAAGPLGGVHSAPHLPVEAQEFLDSHSDTLNDIMAIGGDASIADEKIVYTAEVAVILESKFYRPYTETKNGYGFRVGVEDKNANGKNVVLQTAIPTGYCLELIDDHLPKDFTLFSEDNGKTRKKYDKKMTNAAEKEEGFKSPMLCSLTHIKVLLPEDTNFFGKGAFGFTLKPTTTATKKLKEHCLEFTASADNAQYVEEEFCIKAL